MIFGGRFILPLSVIKVAQTLVIMHALFFLLLLGWPLGSDGVVLRDELLFKHWR